LIKAKRAGKEPPASPAPRPSNVINLMDALRRSVKGGGSETATKAKSSGRATAKKVGAKRKSAKPKKLKKAS